MLYSQDSDRTSTSLWERKVSPIWFTGLAFSCPRKVRATLEWGGSSGTMCLQGEANTVQPSSLSLLSITSSSGHLQRWSLDWSLLEWGCRTTSAQTKSGRFLCLSSRGPTAGSIFAFGSLTGLPGPTSSTWVQLALIEHLSSSRHSPS